MCSVRSCSRSTENLNRCGNVFRPLPLDSYFARFRIGIQNQLVAYKLEDPNLIRTKEVGEPRSFDVMDHSLFSLIDRECAKVSKIFFERLGPTTVWASRSDKHAVSRLSGTAHALNLPLAVVNVDGFGDSDEKPYIKRNVKTITIHSVNLRLAVYFTLPEMLLRLSAFMTTTTPIIC